MNGTDLLATFRNSGSEDAFHELMRRYTNLVFSAAKRRLLSAALAEDVTQTVFTRLAKAVPKLKTDAELVGWLHRTTVHVAIDLWRSETRRRAREQEAVAMEPAHTEDTAWMEISPALDEALNRLHEPDRQALLLRYFDEKTMREIGAILGVSEDAAKMRVSRATDRLRTQLATRGVTCNMLALGALLTERATEAAPHQLASRLAAMELPVVASVGGLAVILLLVRGKAGIVTAAGLLTLLGILIFSSGGWRGSSEPIHPASSNENSQEQNKARREFLERRTAQRLSAEGGQNVRLILRVVDAETGQGLGDTRVRAVHFYAGGRPEGHNLRTDETGIARIPEAREGYNRGMNVFVSRVGYVPNVIGLGKAKEEYVLPLDPALMVGGTVVDETGMPVAGVSIEAIPSENYGDRAAKIAKAQKEFESKQTSIKSSATSGATLNSGALNIAAPKIDFQTTTVTTDENGRWSYHYIPKSWKTVGFYLTCSNYAVTRVSVPVGKPESTNATIVIQRGFAIVGQVSNLQGEPIAGATVKEIHNFGYRKLSAISDSNGKFALFGLADPLQAGSKLVAQMPGMAPQVETVDLHEPTNRVAFVLGEGHLFRGRITDVMGHPISKASVRTDTDFENQISDSFRWQTETDSDGRFEWASAPPAPICYWFEADGYVVIRGRRLIADGSEHDIRLERRAAQ